MPPSLTKGGGGCQKAHVSVIGNIVSILDARPEHFHILFWRLWHMVMSQQRHNTPEHVLVATQVEDVHQIRNVLLYSEARQILEDM